MTKLANPKIVAIGAIIVGIATLAAIILLTTLGRGYPARLASQTSNPDATATSILPVDLAATATQDAIATIVAFKKELATTFVIEMTTSPIPTGIPPAEKIFDAQGPTQKAMRGLGLMVQNVWAGTVNGRDVAVYAGALTAQPDEGGILVWDDDQHGGRQLFRVPGKHGVVKILAENNLRITLASADNAIFYFDVLGLEFVDVLGQPVPTAPVPPTYTPVRVIYPTPYPN
jgi:hypothetical protein